MIPCAGPARERRTACAVIVTLLARSRRPCAAAAPPQEAQATAARRASIPIYRGHTKGTRPEGVLPAKRGTGAGIDLEIVVRHYVRIEQVVHERLDGPVSERHARSR